MKGRANKSVETEVLTMTTFILFCTFLLVLYVLLCFAFNLKVISVSGAHLQLSCRDAEKENCKSNVRIGFVVRHCLNSIDDDIVDDGHGRQQIRFQNFFEHYNIYFCKYAKNRVVLYIVIR